MKFKTTRKELVEKATNLRCAGYGDLQYLLKGVEPVAYTTGVYGWNFDVYMVNGLTICTGYRKMPGQRLKWVAEYEDMARDIWKRENGYTYEQKRLMADGLLDEFCRMNKEAQK